jgi:hypothetical protein
VSGVPWLIRQVLDWMIGFISPSTFTQFGTTGSYSAVAFLHTFEFTVAHALGFSVVTSLILATYLSQPHCNFKSHLKSSYRSLIPFLPFLLSDLRLPSAEFDQVPFRLLFYTILLRTPFNSHSMLYSRSVRSYNSSARTPRKTCATCYQECVFIGSSPSSGCPVVES